MTYLILPRSNNTIIKDAMSRGGKIAVNTFFLKLQDIFQNQFILTEKIITIYLEVNFYSLLIIINSNNFETFDIFHNLYGCYPLFLITAIMGSIFLCNLLQKMQLPNWMAYIGESSIIFCGLHTLIIDNLLVIYSKLGIPYIKD